MLSFLKTLLRKVRPSSSGYATACCPFHNDKNPSLSVSLATGSFRCFACDESGGLGELIAKVEQIPLREGIHRAIRIRAGGRYE